MRPPAPGSPAERRQFARLQRRLRPLYQRVFADALAPRTIVVVPSLSLDADTLAKIDGAPHYEERMLCLLMLLRMPRTRIIYATSVAIHPTTIDYYLHLLTGVPHGHARRRLVLVACGDPSDRPLSSKILSHRSVLRKMRSEIGDPALAHLVCFNVTPAERTLAVRLGIPLYGCDPARAELGSKTGSRQVFAAAGVRAPDGAEDLRDQDDIAGALAALRRQHPRLESAIVKLNEGFSGDGNARFRFRAGDTGAGLERRIARQLATRLKFEASGETWERYRAKFAEMRGVVEACVAGDDLRSPSVQCRIDPTRHIEIVSTHEQILDGPSGQVFVGCQFPADEPYRRRLQDDGERVAAVLRDRGVLGRFGVDFVLVRRGRRWHRYAVEINLRKGGTTHPFLMLDFLTDGSYDRDRGVYRTRSGEHRSYVATDNLRQPCYVGLTPDDLVDIAVANGLHFQGSSQEGVVFHLIGALEEFGKLGMVCIGSDLDRAQRLYGRATEVLEQEGARRTRRARVRAGRRAGAPAGGRRH